VVREGGFGAFVVVEDVGGDFAGAGEGVVAQAGGFTELGLGEAFALAIEDQLGVVDEGHAVGLGKALGAFRDKVNVGTFFEDEARGLDGVAETLDTGHAAGFHAASVHEEGVELHAAVGGEEAAAAGVEGGVVFKDGDGGFDGIEGGAAAGEDGIAGFKGAADTGFVGGGGVGWDGPGAAVYEKNGIVQARGDHRNIVERASEMVQQTLAAAPQWGDGC
jgi:hypothetical protein